MNFAIKLLTALLLAPLAAFAQASKPNIIVILADDMGYADAGFNGCKDIPTPHLDSMAKNGIRFSAGYVTAPQCAPSRAGFLMGVDQNRIGCENNNVTDIAGLSEGATIADRMRAAGYRTGMVGKWHLGTKPGQQPLDRRLHARALHPRDQRQSARLRQSQTSRPRKGSREEQVKSETLQKEKS